MITVENRKLNIPPEEVRLGYEGDNLVAERSFCMSDMSLSEYFFRLDVREANGEMGIVRLEKVTKTDSFLLLWTLTAAELNVPGELTVQLRAFNPNGEEVWHSATAKMTVGTSIKAESTFPSPLPSEFLQIEKSVETAARLVEEKAGMLDSLVTEEWTFVLDNGSTVTKKVVLSK